MQRSASEAIRTQIQPSKAKREITNIAKPGRHQSFLKRSSLGIASFRKLDEEANILKRKSFATLTKMLVPKKSLSDNAIGKSLYLPCIQYKNQNGVAYGCRAATIILRQPPILKSHGYTTWLHYFTCMRKIFF